MSIYTINVGEDKNIAVNDTGNVDGFPIVVNHGMIASINDENLFESLLSNGYRVISVARPGYGQSTAFVLENIKEWGNVIESVTKKTGISRFDILGLSSGAPYSYAIAAVIPNSIRNIYIFSGTPALYDHRIRKLWPYPVNDEMTIPELQNLAKDLFYQNGIDTDDNGSMDSAQNDCFGIALDLMIRCQDWGFALEDVKSKVDMEHGTNDSSVPYETAVITATLLTNCILYKRTSGDHFSRGLLDAFIRNTILCNKYEENA